MILAVVGVAGRGDPRVPACCCRKLHEDVEDSSTTSLRFTARVGRFDGNDGQEDLRTPRKEALHVCV